MMILRASFQSACLGFLAVSAYLLSLHLGGTDRHLEVAGAWALLTFAMTHGVLGWHFQRKRLIRQGISPTAPQSPPRSSAVMATVPLLLALLGVGLQYALPLLPVWQSTLLTALTGASLAFADKRLLPSGTALKDVTAQHVSLLTALVAFSTGLIFPAFWRLPALVVNPSLPGPLLLVGALITLIGLGTVARWLVGWQQNLRQGRSFAARFGASETPASEAPAPTPPSSMATPAGDESPYPRSDTRREAPSPVDRGFTPPDSASSARLSLVSLLLLLFYAGLNLVLTRVGQALPAEGGSMSLLSGPTLVLLATWLGVPLLAITWLFPRLLTTRAIAAFALALGLSAGLGLELLTLQRLLMAGTLFLVATGAAVLVWELRLPQHRSFMRLSLLPLLAIVAVGSLTLATPLNPFNLIRGAQDASDHPAVGQKLLWTGQDAHTLVRVIGTKLAPKLRQVPAQRLDRETIDTERMAGLLAGLLPTQTADALVLGPGTGTALDVLRHLPFLRLDMASPSLLRMSLLQLYGQLNHDVWKEVRIRPMRHGLRTLVNQKGADNAPLTYSSIVALTPPEGLERIHLYSRPGLEALNRLLRPNGWVVMEVPLDGTVPLLPLFSSMTQLFARTHVWLPPESAEQLIVTATQQTGTLSFAHLAKGMTRVELRADLESLRLMHATELLEQLLLTPSVLKALPPTLELTDNLLVRWNLDAELPLLVLKNALQPVAQEVADYPDLTAQATAQSAFDQAYERHRAWLNLLHELRAGDFSSAFQQVQTVRADEKAASGQLTALVSPYLTRAEGLLQDGRAEKAIEQLSVARIIDPKNARIYSLMAKAYLKKGQSDQAQPLLEKALELNPDDLDSALLLADRYRNDRKLASALQVLLPLLPGHPNVAILQHNIGTLYLANSEIQQARTFFSRAIQLDQNLAEAHAGMAQTYLDQSRLDDALIEAQIAARLKPVADHLNLLGQIYLRKGLGGEARSAFVQCLLKNPDHLEAKGAMGILYAESGQIEQARQTWESILAVAPENKAAKENLERLNREFPPLR